MQLHFQLATLKKAGSSVADYYQKFKSLSDNLSAAGQPLNDFEQHSFLLAGLGTDFDSIVASLSTKSELMTIEDLYSHLLIHEQRLEHHTPAIEPVFPSANFAARGAPQRGRGRGNSSSGRFNRGRGKGRGSPPLLPTPPPDSARPVCQICSKPGHVALACYNRFNHAYQRDNSAPIQAFVAASSSASDYNWYPDTGATHHITSDLSNLNLQSEEYTGPDQVHVGNGQGLPISNLGSSNLSYPLSSFQLHNVLHVPQIKKKIYYLFPSSPLIIMSTLNFILLIFVLRIQLRELSSSKANIGMVFTLCLLLRRLLLLPSWVYGLLWMDGILVWVTLLFVSFFRSSLRIIWLFFGHLHLLFVMLVS